MPEYDDEPEPRRIRIVVKPTACQQCNVPFKRKRYPVTLNTGRVVYICPACHATLARRVSAAAMKKPK